MFSCIVTIILVLYALFDVNYFLRASVIYGNQTLRSIFSPTIWSLEDSTVIYGICMFKDVGVELSQMSTARLIREVDFGRYDLYARSGIHAAKQALGGTFLQGATAIRCLAPLKIFARYRQETKLVHWDEKTLFTEHRFVTTKDEITRAVALSRQHLLNLDTRTLLQGFAGFESKRECPEEIQRWLCAIEISKLQLRAEAR